MFVGSSISVACLFGWFWKPLCATSRSLYYKNTYPNKVPKILIFEAKAASVQWVGLSVTEQISKMYTVFPLIFDPFHFPPGMARN